MLAPTKFKGIQPIVAVSNLEEIIQFYTENLGFELSYTEGDPKTLAVVHNGNTELFFLEDRKMNKGHPACFRIQVENIDLLYNDLMAKGLTNQDICPEEKPWGYKEFTLPDPLGNLIIFHQAVLPPCPIGVELNPQLSGQTTVLNPLKVEDYLTLHQMFCDPKVVQYWYSDLHKEKQQTFDFFEQKEKDGTWWTITDKSTDKAIGIVGSVKIEENKAVTLSMMLQHTSMDSELIQDVLQILEKYLFTQKNIPYIEYWIYEGNILTQNALVAENFELNRTLIYKNALKGKERELSIFRLKQSLWSRLFYSQLNDMPKSG